jgi:hypothetical protein
MVKTRRVRAALTQNRPDQRRKMSGVGADSVKAR